jgi:hypothetical protein
LSDFRAICGLPADYPANFNNRPETCSVFSLITLQMPLPTRSMMRAVNTVVAVAANGNSGLVKAARPYECHSGIVELDWQRSNESSTQVQVS